MYNNQCLDMCNSQFKDNQSLDIVNNHMVSSLCLDMYNNLYLDKFSNHFQDTAILKYNSKVIHLNSNPIQEFSNHKQLLFKPLINIKHFV